MSSIIENMEEIREIVPLRSQWTHINCLTACLYKNFFAYDMSPTGSGKTYCSLYLAKLFNLPLCIVCPSQLEDMWTDITTRYGIECEIYSYMKFIFVDFNNFQEELIEILDADENFSIQDLYDDLISQIDLIEEGGKRLNPLKYQFSTLFEIAKSLKISNIPKENNDKNMIQLCELILKYIVTTSEVRDKIDEGMFFIFDEAQKMKNIKTNFTTYHNSNVLRYITKVGGLSRVLYMSATPFDKPFMSSPFLYALNLLPKFTGDDHKKRRIKAEEKVENKINFLSCLKTVDKINPLLSRSIMKHLNVSRSIGSEISHYIRNFDLINNRKDYEEYKNLTNDILDDIDYKFPPIWIDIYFYYVVKYMYSKCSFRMGKHNNYGVKQDIYKFQFNIYFANQYKVLLEELVKDVENNQKYPATIIKSQTLEITKMSELARYFLRVLILKPNYKLVIVVNAKKTIKFLKVFLKCYNPLTMWGDNTVNVRNAIVSKFQEHNLRYRLLICMLTVSSIGINLSDDHGSFPRMGYYIPTFHNIELIQACGRLLRQNTLSSSKVFIVYGKVNEDVGSNYDQTLEDVISHYNSEKSLIIYDLLTNCICINDKKNNEIICTTANLQSVDINYENLEVQLLDY